MWIINKYVEKQTLLKRSLDYVNQEAQYKP